MNNQSLIQNKLDSQHSNKNRAEKIEMLANGLSGNLIIDNYPNLKLIKIISSVDSTQKGKIPNIELTNLPLLEEVSIILCNLEQISFQNCPSIHTLRLRQNKISNLNFLNGLNAEKLTYLSIINNNIEEQDLDYFKHFINLETLSIGNKRVSVKEKRGNNQFKGSLQPLNNLAKLKNLHISKTNISEGLDHLPLSVEKIYCDGSTDFVKPRTKIYQCSKIEKILKIGSWRKSQYIKSEEEDDYFSIESRELEQAQKEFRDLEIKHGKEIMNQVVRRRNNQQEESLNADYAQQNLPFWNDPSTTNKIACCGANVALCGALIALIVGIPSLIALNK